jgi:adenosylcobinamide amidohydrolase
VTYVRTWLHGGLYRPVVAAAGNAKQGTINIFVAPGVL